MDCKRQARGAYEWSEQHSKCLKVDDDGHCRYLLGVIEYRDDTDLPVLTNVVALLASYQGGVKMLPPPISSPQIAAACRPSCCRRWRRMFLAVYFIWTVSRDVASHGPALRTRSRRLLHVCGNFRHPRSDSRLLDIQRWRAPRVFGNSRVVTASPIQLTEDLIGRDCAARKVFTGEYWRKRVGDAVTADESGGFR